MPRCKTMAPQHRSIEAFNPYKAHMTKTTIIAINGLARTWKSTTCELLSQLLNIPYLSAGMLYRAIAYVLPENAIPERISAEDLNNLNIDCAYDGGELIILINWLPVPKDELMKAKNVGAYAKIPAVRSYCNALQRKFVDQFDTCIVQGRDVQYVFRGYPIKMFNFVAPLMVRLNRKCIDIGWNSLETKQLLIKNDVEDVSRNRGPFRHQFGAILVDTWGFESDLAQARYVAQCLQNEINKTDLVIISPDNMHVIMEKYYSEHPESIFTLLFQE